MLCKRSPSLCGHGVTGYGGRITCRKTVTPVSCALLQSIWGVLEKYYDFVK